MKAAGWLFCEWEWEWEWEWEGAWLRCDWLWLRLERAWLWWLIWLAERLPPPRTPGSDSLHVDLWPFSCGEERRALPALGLDPLLRLPSLCWLPALPLWKLWHGSEYPGGKLGGAEGNGG